MRHVNMELLNEGGAGTSSEAAFAAAADAAVSTMLTEASSFSEIGAGGGLQGFGSTNGCSAGAAVVWPPAVPLWEGGSGGAAETAAAGEREGGRAEAQAACDPVEVFMTCEASLLRGLEAVRCVVAGQGDGAAVAEGMEQDEEPEPEQEQERVYVDSVVQVVPAAVERQQQGQQDAASTEAAATALGAAHVAHLR